MAGFFSNASDSAVNASVAEAEEAVESAVEAENEARAWAVGTNPDGTDIPSDGDSNTPDIENNAKYWSEQAQVNAGMTDVDVQGGTNITVTGEGTNSDPYIVNNDLTAGTGVAINGSGVVSLSAELTELSDVNLSNPSNNQYLRYNGSEWTNEAIAVDHNLTAGTGINIDNSDVISVVPGDIDFTDLEQVSVSNPASGQFLKFDGSNWTNDSLDESLHGLTDVSISNPTDNQFLRYDGSEWVNETVNIGGSGSETLAGLDDVDLTTTPTDDQVLTFDNDDMMWKAMDVPLPDRNLNSLNDVDTTGVQDGWVLAFDGLGGSTGWVASPLNESLNNITDVVLTNSQDNDFLRFNGTNWVNEAVTIPTQFSDFTNYDLGELEDVNTTGINSPNDNEVLTWEQSTGTWHPAPVPSASVDNLTDIGDVVITSPSTNQYLRYDGSNWINETVSAGSGVSAGTGIAISASDVISLNASIDNLNDVTITSPSTNQYLRFNGTNWINETVSQSSGLTAGNGIDINASDVISVDFSDGNLTSLGDVTITSVADNQFLRYDSDNTAWVNETVTYTLGDNTDVTITSPTDNQFLRHNGTNWVNESVTIPTNITSLTDVTVNNPSDNEFLRYNGSVWVNEAVTFSTSVSALTDTTISNPSEDQFLRYNATNSRWENETVVIPVNLNDLSNRTLPDLTDVAISSPAENEFLRYDNGFWVNEAVTIVSALDNLTDVSISSPSDNQFLRHNGTNWVNESVTLQNLHEGAGIDISATEEISVDLTELSFNFSDVDTSGASNGQVLTYDGSEWVPQTSSGGNTDNSRLSIALSPTSLNEGDNSTTITVTLSISNALSGETISAQAVTVTDPTGHTVSVSGSGNTWTFTASGANVGNYVVRANATFTISGTASPHSATRNLPVHATGSDWYTTLSTTQPTAITSMTDEGVFSSPETWDTGNGNGTGRTAYVALPTHAAGYTIHTGLLTADTTSLGTISSNYTLYSFDDFTDTAGSNTNLIFTITEN